jgi:hypothetical protein
MILNLIIFYYIIFKNNNIAYNLEFYGFFCYNINEI